MVCGTIGHSFTIREIPIQTVYFTTPEPRKLTAKERLRALIKGRL